MAYFINYWKFNEIRKYIHKQSNVSQHLGETFYCFYRR